jgi:predicted thioesterase
MSSEPATGPEPGLSIAHDFVAEGLLLTDVGGTIGVNVLSTPGMIAVMEGVSTQLVAEHLPPGTATVGFEVCIKHVSGAAEGATLTAHSTLREVVDGRKLRFDVEVREGDRTIGVGRHERRMIVVDAHAAEVGGPA